MGRWEGVGESDKWKVEEKKEIKEREEERR
jgi:hypothetical protein